MVYEQATMIEILAWKVKDTEARGVEGHSEPLLAGS